MHLLTISSFLSLVTPLLAQRPGNISICDHYTTSIFGLNTAPNEKLLITLLMNTVVLGSYTTPNNSVKVDGIAAPGTYNGTSITLLHYFTGELLSTNPYNGSAVGVSKLFLDDGGATALQMNKSSNGNPASAQTHLLSHIYEWFGVLLGCSLQGGTEFPTYDGVKSMYEVHRFMNLDLYQLEFFVKQVVDSSSALGFSKSDSATIATLLAPFNTRCSPPFSVKGISTEPELQSCCVAASCPLDVKGDCSIYPENGVAIIPKNITETATVNQSGSSTASGALPTKTGTTTSIAANLEMGSEGTGIFGLVFGLAGAILVAYSGL